jgi:hypothetical protein
MRWFFTLEGAVAVRAAKRCPSEGRSGRGASPPPSSHRAGKEGI